MKAIERALIRGELSSLSEGSTDSTHQAVHWTIEGNYEAVFTSEHSNDLLRNPSDAALTPATLLSSLPLVSRPLSGEKDECMRLCCGISFLHAYLQANWTGPDVPFNPISIFPTLPSTITEKSLSEEAIKQLAFGGEPAYHLAKQPFFLLLAKLVFELPYQHHVSAVWWRLRALRTHQQTLDEPVPHAVDFLGPLFHDLSSSTDGDGDGELIGQLYLERGLLRHLFHQDKLAAEHFVSAAKESGLQYELTGALGRRTKFQKNDLTQLVLLAESRLKLDGKGVYSEPATNDAGTNAAAVPDTLALNDDTLLEKTQFTTSDVSSSSFLSHLDPNSQPPLHPLDQCILLGLCLNVKNTSPAHGLTSEQMSPYVSRVISHPLNWSVHTMALLLRSRLESTRTRTVERSTFQLQALIDQMPTADSTLNERLRYLHGIAMPSKWELEKELAMRYMSLGVLRSGLEIFERLEMWSDVVHCWQALERPEKGITIVRELLSGTKQDSEAVVVMGKERKSVVRTDMDAARAAKLWCLLGELEPENAVEHFTTAWELSNHTSGRAVRSLGGYHFAKAEYAKAIEALESAVVIQPLLSRSWFILGCAYTRLEDWEGAKTAFSRCVSINDEDGESWNNLASVYLRLGASSNAISANDEDESVSNPSPLSPVSISLQKKDVERPTIAPISFENKLLAFRALKEGLRHSYSNWRMWSNYMVVCIDVGEMAEACRALSRIVEERSEKDGAAAIDLEVLDRLVNAVTRSSNEPNDPNQGEGLYPRVDDLFKRVIIPRVSPSPRIWRNYARLLTWKGHWGKAVEAYVAAYRCGVALDPAVETDLERWRDAVGEVEELVDVFRNFGPKAALEVEKQSEADYGSVDGVVKKKREGSWLFQAKGVVRTFMGRTKATFGDEPEWEKLLNLLEELKPT